MKLNLGSGNKPLDGYVNVDLYAESADQRADLFSFPWPWQDQSVDEIVMSHFFEHVPDLIKTVAESWRILKDGGRFKVIVPHGQGISACSVGHLQFLTRKTFMDLCSDSIDFYTWRQGHPLFVEESYRVQVVETHSIHWTPLDGIASRFPVLFEKLCPIRPALITWTGRAVHGGAP